MATNTSSVSTAPLWTLRLDQADPNNVYLGYALIGAATSAAKWRIQKIQTTSNVLSILYANGSTKADQVWDNRSGLSYS